MKMMRIAKLFISFLFLIFTIRNLNFIIASLRWPASLSLDATTMRFESYQILHGIWPGRDFVSINLPFTHYINILGFFVFGAGDIGFRFLDIFWIIGTAFTAFFYYRDSEKRIGWIAFALVLWLPVEATPFGAFQREIIFLPFVLISVWALRNSDASKYKVPLVIFAGGIAVCTVFIKPTNLVFWITYYIYHVYKKIRRKEQMTSVLGESALLAGGGILALIAILLPLLVSGVLSDFFRGWYFQTQAYLSLVEKTDPLTLLTKLIAFDPTHFFQALNQPYLTGVDTGHLSWLYVFIVLVWVSLAFRHHFDLMPLFLFFSGLFAYAVQMRGFQYHLYPVWFALMLMTAELCYFCISSRRKELLTGALLLTFCLLIVQNNSFKVYKGTGLGDHRKQPPSFFVPAQIGDLSKQIRLSGQKEVTIATFEHPSIALSSVIDYDLKYISPYPVDYILHKPSVYRETARKRLIEALLRQSPDIIAMNADFAPLQYPGILTETELKKIRLIPTAFSDFKDLEILLKEKYTVYAGVCEHNHDIYIIYRKRK